MRYVTINHEIENAKFEIEVGVSGGCVESVVAYYKGKRHPKLSKWAEGYIGSTRGEMELEDACRDDGVTLWDGRPW